MPNRFCIHDSRLICTLNQLSIINIIDMRVNDIIDVSIITKLDYSIDVLSITEIAVMIAMIFVFGLEFIVGVVYCC